jgi:hypothetical protein
MELSVHGPRDEVVEVVEVVEAALVRELVLREGDLIWIAGAVEPLELDATVIEAGLSHGGHVHRGPCRAVKIEVRHRDEVASIASRPSATCETITTWAVGKLGLGDPADFDLIDLDGGEVIPPGRHVGELIRRGACTVCLDLRRADVYIVVNAEPHTVPPGRITFEAIVAIAYPTPPGPDPEYTVSYRKGRPDHPKGTLHPGHTVEVREGMIFVVTATDKS